MNQAPSLYNLYCINIQCEASIYHNNRLIKVIFNEENLAANHICTSCRYSMFSAMDLEIEQITAEVGVVSVHKPYYNSGH